MNFIATWQTPIKPLCKRIFCCGIFGFTVVESITHCFSTFINSHRGLTVIKQCGVGERDGGRNQKEEFYSFSSVKIGYLPTKGYEIDHRDTFLVDKVSILTAWQIHEKQLHIVARPTKPYKAVTEQKINHATSVDHANNQAWTELCTEVVANFQRMEDEAVVSKLKFSRNGVKTEY
ncbi:unnamed protein product [Dovyalis caffra]|uniref:Uncharacterized protein n=1 Tax=Dovyalis caffra TaxID=77055 RepID=A0AAV1SID5_9ROSI|nr:unnamed protein product [Dovyalis caffra]